MAAGDNAVLLLPGLDLDGNLRIASAGPFPKADMGAYEYGSPSFIVTQVIPADGGGVELIWNGQPNDTYTIWSCDDMCIGFWTVVAIVGSQGEFTS